jgi:mono/diheme cytochrome c family protein
MRAGRCVLVLLLWPLACRKLELGHADFERMRHQPHYKPYEAVLGTRDRPVMLTPPVGTVPRAESTRARSAVTGAQLFVIYCAVCHGPAGTGGSVVGANMRPVQPPSLLTARARGRSAEELFGIVSNGFANMPGYSWALSVQDRWAIIAYVRTLQGAP